MFEIIPAIDLRGGRCVRLFQGDFARETVFGHDPVEMARRWEALGAGRLHVVDLDGARLGVPAQLQLVEKMARAVRIPVELGGGLRTLEDVQRALAVGVERVVLGTSAIGGQDQGAARAFRGACLARAGERVVIGLDARDGRLAIRGWTETTRQDALEHAELLRSEGFGRIIYTDISRDGALRGPNLRQVRRLTKIDGLAIIASGGISNLTDLLALAASGAEGAIVGQALYTGAITLPEAIERLAPTAAGA
jgi:phosphoribosylformimino-5-aminoimidazole carboxamide ribotide isomerase